MGRDPFDRPVEALTPTAEPKTLARVGEGLRACVTVAAVAVTSSAATASVLVALHLV